MLLSGIKKFYLEFKKGAYTVNWLKLINELLD